jgi:hypothetical protein
MFLSRTSSPQCCLIPSRRRAHPSGAQVVSEVPRDGQELALVDQDRTAPLAPLRYAVGFHGLGQLCLTEPSGFLARNSLRRFIVAANHESQIANMPILRWFQAFQKQEPNGTINTKSLAADRSERKLRSLRRSTRFAAVGLRRQTGSCRAPCQQKTPRGSPTSLRYRFADKDQGAAVACLKVPGRVGPLFWNFLCFSKVPFRPNEAAEETVCLRGPFQKKTVQFRKNKARRLGTFLSGSFIIPNERRARREHNAIQTQKPYRAPTSAWWVARCDAR